MRIQNDKSKDSKSPQKTTREHDLSTHYLKYFAYTKTIRKCIIMAFNVEILGSQH